MDHNKNNVLYTYFRFSYILQVCHLHMLSNFSWSEQTIFDKVFRIDGIFISVVSCLVVHVLYDSLWYSPSDKQPMALNLTSVWTFNWKHEILEISMSTSEQLTVFGVCCCHSILVLLALAIFKAIQLDLPNPLMVQPEFMAIERYWTNSS